MGGDSIDVVFGEVFRPIPGFQIPIKSLDPELSTPTNKSNTPFVVASIPTNKAPLNPEGVFIFRYAHSKSKGPVQGIGRAAVVKLEVEGRVIDRCLRPGRPQGCLSSGLQKGPEYFLPDRHSVSSWRPDCR